MYNSSLLSNSGPSTSSALDLAYDWLTTCRTSQSFHVRCNETHLKEPGWYPTRLIDIGERGARNWNLRVISQDGKPDSAARYMTLSYRWGENPTLLLLKSNIDDLRAGNLIHKLPLTFRDFIIVARRFVVRYVWIDALCIIQDSESDWEAEAPMMRYVYANSVCNVAASASSDPEGGLFRERPAKSLMPGLISSSPFSDRTQNYFIADIDYWKHEVDYGPFHKRGWVYQEILLAPRILYFDQKQILWECSAERNSEFGFRSGTSPAYPLQKNQLFRYLTASSDAESGQMSENIQKLWMELVQEYSSCVLTKPCDKLFAFSGIAKLFQQYTNDVYVAGLWKSRLVETMDCYVALPKPLSSSTYRAPSWSWAALDGPVLRAAFRERVYDVKVLDLQFTTGSDPTIDVTDAHLKLRARTIPASY